MSLAPAPPPGPQYTYRAAMERVVDGDTLIARIDLGFRVAVAVPLRIADIDTPELGTAAGDAAKDYLVRLTERAPLLVQTVKDRRSFERWVAHIWTPTDAGPWTSIADLIFETGHGTRVRSGSWTATRIVP